MQSFLVKGRHISQKILNHIPTIVDRIPDTKTHTHTHGVLITAEVIYVVCIHDDETNVRLFDGDAPQRHHHSDAVL